MAATNAPANKRRGCLGVVIFLAVVVILIIVLVATCHGAADDPALAAAAQKALAANSTVASLIDTVSAQDDGSVIVTLNETTSALAGSAGSNGAEKVGAYVNAAVLDAVPGAKSVGTFDADNKLLELSTRK